MWHNFRRRRWLSPLYEEMTSSSWARRLVFLSGFLGNQEARNWLLVISWRVFIRRLLQINAITLQKLWLCLCHTQHPLLGGKTPRHEFTVKQNYCCCFHWNTELRLTPATVSIRSNILWFEVPVWFIRCPSLNLLKQLTNFWSPLLRTSEPLNAETRRYRSSLRWNMTHM